MKIFFIGEVYFSALCLESILNEGIDIDEVLTTKDTTNNLTKIVQMLDAEVMMKKGFEHDYYWKRTQRFLENVIARRSKSNISSLPYIHPSPYGMHIPPGIDTLVSQTMTASQRANVHELKKFNSFDKEFFDYVSNKKPDLVIVAGLSKKVPKEFLDAPKYGFINCHPSLLPNYRGPSPEFYVIQNGESYSGLTIHRMDENWDTGEILAQENFDVSELDCVGDLEVKEGNIAGKLIRRVLENIDSAGVSQVAREGSYFKAYSENDLMINWSATAQKNQRLARAKPEGYAFTYVEGEKIYITHSRIGIDEPKVNVGKVFKVNDEGTHVRCEGGCIIIQNAVYSSGLLKYLRKPTFREGMVLGQR